MRIWNQITNGVVTTHDVIWLKQICFERKADEEVFTLDDDGKKIKVEATDEEQSDEEKEDDDIPELLDDKNANVEEAKEADDEPIAGETETDATTTWSGRTVQTPARLPALVKGGLSDFRETSVNMKYLGSMAELDNNEIVTAAVTEEKIQISQVGASVGGGFKNTSKLKVMNYCEAM